MTKKQENIKYGSTARILVNVTKDWAKSKNIAEAGYLVWQQWFLEMHGKIKTTYKTIKY